MSWLLRAGARANRGQRGVDGKDAQADPVGMMSKFRDPDVRLQSDVDGVAPSPTTSFDFPHMSPGQSMNDVPITDFLCLVPSARLRTLCSLPVV